MIWEKQNLREGFRETFKPLISQFEKPEDFDDKLKKEGGKTENPFTQNRKLIQNQLAITAGLVENQKALTDGLNQNILAITEGFDFANDVSKRGDLAY